jgi:hypothetical protein
MGVYESGRGPLLDSESPRVLILDFPTSITVSKYLLFRDHPVYDIFVIEAQKDHGRDHYSLLHLINTKDQVR